LFAVAAAALSRHMAPPLPLTYM